MKWDFRRILTGFTLPELLVGTAIAAILIGATVTAVTYWNKAKAKAINSTQVPLIDSALRQYLRAYGHLPDLSDPAEIPRWLSIYPAANGQPMPQGISYRIQRQYVLSTLSTGQIPGEVLLVGIGCTPFETPTFCRLSLIP